MDWFGTIGDAFLKIVLPSLGTVIAGFVVLVLKRVAHKYGIEVTEKQEERLKQIVIEKVHAVEEAAHRDPSLKGAEKNVKAVTAAIKAAEADPSIPNPSVEKVSEVVDATLAEKRAGYLPNPGLPGLGKR